jgi:hypothetical protein
MDLPSKFLPRVIDGSLVRYGCILKEVATGRIVGHLKEVGAVPDLLSRLPLGGLPQIGQWIDPHVQLKRIQSVLNHLQLVSTVGAAASVAGLGVSVAGFAVVLNRLNRLEQNLNRAMSRLQAQVERLSLKMDMVEMAELHAAWENLRGASDTNRPERAPELLKQANRAFQKYRNYYYALVMELRPLGRPELSLPQVREMYGRFFACALAELEANFLLHDFAQWQHRHQEITKQLAEACAPDAAEMVRSRVDALGLVPQGQLEELTEQVRVTRDACQESRVRILTANEEVRWLERQKLTPQEYLAALRSAPEEGVVLLPHTA